MVTKTRCERCTGNLYPYEGAMKCLQCGRSFGGPEPEGLIQDRRFTRAFKVRAIRRARELGSWSRAAQEFGVDPGGLQMWGYKL
ncbi:hypothetical protein LCGC14_0853110 [marine sediment metagenome]|uniref:Transposase n=1 Tax=marine sediment metagenome TaxID=412755 RepID=A0A0F9PEH0_9ZZZZ